MKDMILEKLFKVIQNRKKRLPKNSYVASLFRVGKDRIIQKVGEEAIEVIIAAKSQSKQKVIEEIADLWFHILILMVLLEISPKDIRQELERRKKAR